MRRRKIKRLPSGDRREARHGDGRDVPPAAAHAVADRPQRGRRPAAAAGAARGPTPATPWLTALPALSGLGSVAYMFAGPGEPDHLCRRVDVPVLLAGDGRRQRAALADSARRATRTRSRRDYLRYLRRRSGARSRGSPPRSSELALLAPARRPTSCGPSRPAPGCGSGGPATPTSACVRVGVGDAAPGDAAGHAARPSRSRSSTRCAPPRCAGSSSPTATRPGRARCRWRPRGLAADPAVRRAARRARGLARADRRASSRRFHAPDDLRIVVCTRDPDAPPSWEWVKWLPHALHARRDATRSGRRGWSPRPGGAGGAARRRARRRRPRFTRDAEPDRERRRTSWSCSTTAARRRRRLAAATATGCDGGDRPRPGRLAPAGSTAPARHASSPSTDGSSAQRRRRRARLLGSADALSVPARPTRWPASSPRCALDTAAAQTEDRSTADLGLPDLLGVARPGRAGPRPARGARAPSATGCACRSASARRRTGRRSTSRSPRRAAWARTGWSSGRPARASPSCCARWCSAWRSRTRPRPLNFVLVDFKGGATFAGLDELPHTSAVITNLADDLTLVDRMQRRAARAR